MKILVCGGRDYANEVHVFLVLDSFHRKYGISAIVTGAARGADYLAGKWAKKNSIELIEYPADWKKHGKAAGPIRNQEMLEKESPKAVLAFPGGSGTEDMISRSKKVGIDVYKVRMLHEVDQA